LTKNSSCSENILPLSNFLGLHHWAMYSSLHCLGKYCCICSSLGYCNVPTYVLFYWIFSDIIFCYYDSVVSTNFSCIWYLAWLDLLIL
jgi:hypothetical protein